MSGFPEPQTLDEWKRRAIFYEQRLAGALQSNHAMAIAMGFDGRRTVLDALLAELEPALGRPMSLVELNDAAVRARDTWRRLGPPELVDTFEVEVGRGVDDPRNTVRLTFSLRGTGPVKTTVGRSTELAITAILSQISAFEEGGAS